MALWTEQEEFPTFYNVRLAPPKLRKPSTRIKVKLACKKPHQDVPIRWSLG